MFIRTMRDDIEFIKAYQEYQEKELVWISGASQGLFSHFSTTYPTHWSQGKQAKKADVTIPFVTLISQG